VTVLDLSAPGPRVAWFWRQRGEPTRTPVYDTYWRLASERQEIYFRRQAGEPPPWTQDAVLQDFKFTNAYRSVDRTSQYLIQNVVYAGDQTARQILFRTLLFKLFNRIGTWELICRELGFPDADDFEPERYARVLDEARAARKAIYSAAYIVPPVDPGSGLSKHRGHLALLNRIITAGVADSILTGKSLEDVYLVLRGVRSFGSFLAFQLAIDLNYGPAFVFPESAFVVAGPGAREGIAKCFSSREEWTDEDIIYWVADRQTQELEKLGLAFRTLWGRPLQPIDCQNLFCETAKYARVAHPSFTPRGGRSRIKQRYRNGGRLPDPWFPPAWGINDAVSATLDLRRSSA
jgi:hypothetical protein